MRVQWSRIGGPGDAECNVDRGPNKESGYQPTLQYSYIPSCRWEYCTLRPQGSAAPKRPPRPPPYHLPKPPSSSVVRTTSPLPSMSHATVSSPSNFQLIISNALDQYKKRTKTDLITHPLAAQLQSCNSPNAILAILQQQVQALYQSRSSDERWSRWLDPTVNVIYALSSTVAAGVSLVCLGT
jgi:hypothetical protein